MTTTTTTTPTAAAFRRAAAAAANAERARQRAARRAAERAATVEQAALDVLAALTAERAGKSQRRSPAAIHAINRAASRRVAAGDNSRAAARAAAARAERHALIVTPSGGKRIDVPAPRLFAAVLPAAGQGATLAALAARAERLADRAGYPRAAVLALFDGLTAQQFAARLAELERRAAMAAHPAGRARD